MILNRKMLTELIGNIVNNILKEYKYYDDINPDNSKTNRYKNLGLNPLSVDNGGHQSNDVVKQVSTFDKNGEMFTSNDRIFLNKNQFVIYKIKNFGTDSISSTISLFGKGSIGEKNLRSAIDLLNGGATRNGKNIIYRTITLETSLDKAKKSGWMIDTFWEFSINNGGDWYILKPKPLEDIKKSKLK